MFLMRVLFFVSLAVNCAYAQYQDPHPSLSQTFLRQSNGTIVVLPSMVSDTKVYEIGSPNPKIYEKSALIYTKRNPLPELQSMGANYAFFKGNYLSTVSADGFLIYKGKMNFETSVQGGNFFVKKGSSEIVVVDSFGYFVNTGMIAPSIRLVGGNYFIDESGTLTTIKSVGANGPGSNLGIMTVKTGWSFSDAVVAGGNYFIKQDGSLVAISSITGFFTDDPYLLESKPLVIGGNYLIGENNFLYTVSNEGKLFKTIEITKKPVAYGYSYIIFSDGSFAMITANGGVHLEAVSIAISGKSEYTQRLPVDVVKNFSFLPKN